MTINGMTMQAIRDDNSKAQKAAQNTELEIIDKTLAANLTAQGQANEAVINIKQTTEDPFLATLNGVDELRYLLICSQVELLDTPEPLNGLQYNQQFEDLGIGVVKADGEKCDRCWNYSVHVGESKEDPTICERCIEALAGTF
jgi:isoleucyl-tRNA synthetase